MPHDPEVDALADRLMPALFRAVRRLKRDAPPMSFNPVELMVLFTIHHAPGIGMAELAAREGLSSPTMSAHVKRLEAAGWLTRSDDAQDGRRSGLAVTTAGGRKLEAIQRLRNDWLSARLALLTDAERAQLAAAAAPLLRLVSVDA